MQVNAGEVKVEFSNSLTRDYELIDCEIPEARGAGKIIHCLPKNLTVIKFLPFIKPGAIIN